MIVWTGYGVLAAIFGLLPALMYEAARAKYPLNPAAAWGQAGIGFVIAAVGSALAGRAMNGSWRGGPHTLWFIPVQFWAVPYLIGAAAALNTGYKVDTHRWRVTPRRGIEAPPQRYNLGRPAALDPGRD